jgi:hypothetical protein
MYDATVMESQKQYVFEAANAIVPIAEAHLDSTKKAEISHVSSWP